MVGEFNHLQQLDGALFGDERTISAKKIRWKHDVLEQAEGGHQLKRLIHDAQMFAAPLRQLVFAESVDWHEGCRHVIAHPVK